MKDYAPQQPTSILEKLNKEWFVRFAAYPHDAHTNWKNWLATYKHTLPSEKKMYKKAAVFCINRNDKTFENYWNPEKSGSYKEQIGQQLDAITQSLGHELPDHRKGKQYKVERDKNKIALITELQQIPSLYFHQEVIAGVIHAAKKHNYLISLHEASKDQLKEVIEKIDYSFFPAAILIIRMTPDKDTITFLEEKNLPAVLIHADKKDYTLPIIGNIIPITNSTLKDDFLNWCKDIPSQQGNEQPEIVMVYVPPYDQYRKNRIGFFKQILENEPYKITVKEVTNYEFTQAMSVWDDHPAANAYISFSDQIAVGLKQLASVRRKKSMNPFPKILGFDDSPIAEEAGISSINQCLQDTGHLAINKLFNFFQDQKIDRPTTFELIEVHMELINREIETA